MYFSRIAAFIPPAMKPLIRSFALVAILAAVLITCPACYRQPGDTAKLFYLEQMEKTNAFQAQHEKHEEKKEAEHAEKPATPATAPEKLVPESK